MPHTQEEWNAYNRLAAKWKLDKKREEGAPLCVFCGYLADEHIEIGTWPKTHRMCPTSFWQPDKEA